MRPPLPFADSIARCDLDVFDQHPVDPSSSLLKPANAVAIRSKGSCPDESAGASRHLSVETAVALTRGRWPLAPVNGHVKPGTKLA